MPTVRAKKLRREAPIGRSRIVRPPEHLNLPAVVVLFWLIGAVTRLFVRRHGFALMKATVSWPLFRRQLFTPNLDYLGCAPGARCLGVDQAEHVSGARTMTPPSSAHFAADARSGRFTGGARPCRRARCGVTWRRDVGR